MKLGALTQLPIRYYTALYAILLFPLYGRLCPSFTLTPGLIEKGDNQSETYKRKRMTENSVPSTQEAFTKIMTRLDQIEKKVVNPTTPFSKEWIDTQEVCEMLHLSKRTLQNYRDQGKIPFSQIDGKMYYRHKDIMNILESNYTPLKPSRTSKSNCNGFRR